MERAARRAGLAARPGVLPASGHRRPREGRPDRRGTRGHLRGTGTGLPLPCRPYHGPRPPSGSVVALCLPRSARFVEAALAVLRCGLAFLPVDMEQPPRRRAFVLSDAGAAAVIAPSHAGLDALPPGVKPLGLDAAEAAAPGDGFEDRPVDAEAPPTSSRRPEAPGCPRRSSSRTVH
ncbi:AMP-binding protein [Streptomyces sp. FXJ1.4098]|nr:AMP-binding protein [Streptomyces sp. FXJ1.4098]